MSTIAVLIPIAAFALVAYMVLHSLFAPKDGLKPVRFSADERVNAPLRIIRGSSNSAPLRINRGFTLIELMIVIAIVGIFAAVFLPMLTNMGNLRGSSAEAGVAANAYYKSMYPEYGDFRVNCAGSDSDGDGYVSCSGRGMKTGTDTWANLPPVQCGGGGLAAAQRGVSGCKSAAGVIIQQ